MIIVCGKFTFQEQIVCFILVYNLCHAYANVYEWYLMEGGYELAYKQKHIPFLKRPWVSSIGVFVLSQIIFITLEATGWIPNYRDFSGTLFGRITDSSFFREWFTFYETKHFNLLTIFFGIVFLVPGIVGAMKSVFSPRST